MAEITQSTPADYVRQPWRNGGGTTTELARGGDGDRWRWRLSIADVERSGPFSDFTGYRLRVLDASESWCTKVRDSTLLHAVAGRVDLAIDGRTIALAPGDTLHADDVAASTISATALDANAVLAHAAIAYRR